MRYSLPTSGGTRIHLYLAATSSSVGASSQASGFLLSDIFSLENVEFVNKSFQFAEKHTKRQVTQHGWLSSLLGNGDKWIEIVYGEEEYFESDRIELPRQDKNLLYRHDKLSEPTKEWTLSYVLPESPFTSVLTVSRSHLSLRCKKKVSDIPARDGKIANLFNSV